MTTKDLVTFKVKQIMRDFDQQKMADFIQAIIDDPTGTLKNTQDEFVQKLNDDLVAIEASTTDMQNQLAQVNSLVIQ